MEIKIKNLLDSHLKEDWDNKKRSCRKTQKHVTWQMEIMMDDDDDDKILETTLKFFF